MKVLTDYKRLEYFMTIKKLTSRQTRLVKFLSEYNFIISYQSGKKNKKADALTKKLNKQLNNKNNERLEYHIQTLLLPERFKHAVENAVNLEPVEVRNLPNEDITSAVDSAEPHEDFLILLEKIKKTN